MSYTLSSLEQEKQGMDLLHDAEKNKSTAFTAEERAAFKLEGLLPAGIETIELQMQRVFQQLGAKTTDLERYIFLLSLLDIDQTLFYKVVMSDPARLLPIIYAPTVGEACLNFGHIFRRPRGLYLSIKHKGRIKEVLKNWPKKEIRVICVTSAGRILGLGDLGANGMGIPIGKLQLYTACAAVPPQYLLPLHIDFGTDNSSLINDPLYLGLRQPRVATAEVDAFVEEFVMAVQEVFPNCCIHFEDWAGVDAVRLLAKYRDRVCCYNDDIQGTAGVALTGLLSALRIVGGKLSDQRILFLGAGSAGVGMANLVAQAMELEGISAEQARGRIHMFDINGLLESNRTDLYDFQKPYAHKNPALKDFVAAIEHLKPTTLFGVSTQGKAFNQKVIETMTKLNKRPIIFALSNPTDHAECTAEEAYKWSEGRALYAAGVQFPPVKIFGKMHVPGQGNNIYIFPAVGLSIFATRARRITDKMFIAAAQGVAEQVTQEDLDLGLLYPPISQILKTEIHTAVRVCEVIFQQGLAGIERPKDIAAFLETILYKPEYKNFQRP